MPNHQRPARTALTRRIAPSVPLALDLRTDSGAVLHFDFRLSWDFNAIALVEEMTGKSLLSGEVWNHLTAATLGVMFWASLLAHHPEYEGKEGLAIVRSFMDAGNAAVITAALTDAFIASLPPEQQESMRAARKGSVDPTEPVPVPPQPAGANSGLSRDSISASDSPSSAN